MSDRDTGDPRAAFAAALTGLRQRLPNLSDEALARRASALALPSGRRVVVNARRLGEWLNGQSVPRQFDAVHAVIHAIDSAAGGPAPAQPTMAQWQRLWRAAQHHPAASTGHARTRVAVGRPPTDAAALQPRTELAAAIDDALRDGSVRQVLLTGAGGVGKSQLASAAFHRARDRADVLVWVPAATRQSVLAGYARAWRALAKASVDSTARGPSTDPGWDDETQADLFVAWLRSTSTAWLVVLDDVDEPGELSGLWPVGAAGRSVVTTRRRDAVLLRPDVRVIPVGMFTPSDATAYLSTRLSLDPAPPAHRDRDDLARLAVALGHFPLALSQAAAFLIDTGMSLTAYLRLLADQRESVSDLFPPSSPADEHDGTVAGTVHLALDRAESLAPPGTARAMIELISLLTPDGIPDPVLLGRAARRWVGGGTQATERTNLLALRALHRLSLVTHNQRRDPAVVEVHALVQRAVRDSVPSPDRARLAGAAADAIEEVWSAPDCDPEIKPTLYRCAEVLLATAGDDLWDGGMHPLLRRLGEHLIVIGRPDAAREIASRLLDEARERLGDGHRDVLFLRSQVAHAVGDSGGHAAALASLEEIAHEARFRLGQSDVDTLTVRHFEVRYRMESGLIEPALHDFDVLIADAETVLPAVHPLLVTTRDVAALCRGLSGDAAGARDAYAALADQLSAELGPRHPATLNALIGLGRWIGATGDAHAAVDTYRTAVEGLESVVGRLHHDTLIARHNLAYWRNVAGDLDLGITELAAAANDAELTLGAEHPTTLTYQVNLAFWQGLGGAHEAALADLGRLRRMIEAVFGAEHPRALRVRQQRADLLHRAGDRVEAVAELESLLAEMTRIQGANHPWTLETTQLLEQATASGRA